MNTNYAITLVITLLAGIAIGWLLRRPATTVKTVKYTEYVPVHDTVVIERERWRVHRQYDTVVVSPAVVMREDTFFVTDDLVAVFDTVVATIVGDSIDLDHRIAVFGGGDVDTAVVVREPVPIIVQETAPAAAPPPAPQVLPPSRMVAATLSTTNVAVMGWWGRTVTAGGGISYDYEWKKATPIIGIGVRW